MRFAGKAVSFNDDLERLKLVFRFVLMGYSNERIIEIGRDFYYRSGKEEMKTVKQAQKKAVPNEQIQIHQASEPVNLKDNPIPDAAGRRALPVAESDPVKETADHFQQR